MHATDQNLEFSGLSLVDVGRVFFWNDRVFRGFPPAAAAAVRALFDCGLVARLVADGYLVASWISEQVFAEFALVVEHEAIAVTTYPREWSFEMLKDAALLVLRLNDVARGFGYQTKDCNGYNVLFRHGRPVYIDLGSFIPIANRADVLFPYKEFLLAYYYPLCLWQSVGQQLGQRVVPRAVGRLLAPETYLRYRWPVLRHASDRVLARGFKISTALRWLAHADFDHLRERRSAVVVRALEMFKRGGWLERPARIAHLVARTTRLAQRHGGASMWAGYHDPHARGAELMSTPRFDAVIARLAALDVASMLEIAGNQGVLSRLAVRARPALRAICTDADTVAIDKGYRATGGGGERIEWAVLNPFADESSPVEIAATRRFGADAVVALAITHHLTLTQGLHLRYVFEVLRRYAKRYVITEFMPLGLHDGERAPPVPEWYCEAWFADEFARHFSCLERVQLEPNRVLYVGAIAR